MTDQKLYSPLERARLNVVQWLDAVPAEHRSDAVMALEKLCDVATRQISDAYWEGYDLHRVARKIDAMKKAIASADQARE